MNWYPGLAGSRYATKAQVQRLLEVTAQKAITEALAKALDDLEANAVLRSYETISRNLDPRNAAFIYDTEGRLTTVDYGDIQKTLAYSDGRLTSVSLSGNVPAGINLTKTLAYDGTGRLTGYSYGL